MFSDEREVFKELEIRLLPRDIKDEKIPGGYNVYLIHPRDVRLDDLKDLRREQPYSLFYCLNRVKVDVPREEQNAYDYFLPWIDKESANDVITKAKERMERR